MTMMMMMMMVMMMMMMMMMIDDDDASASAKPQRWKPTDPLAFFRCTKKFILRHVQKPFTFLTLPFIYP